MAKRKAMTSEDASKKKTDGHKREKFFADLIGGEVNKGNQRDKRDVMDETNYFHSVKSSKWWQIFLYGRKLWETNTEFRGMNGDIASIMIECLDAFPVNRSDYLEDKHKYKIALQEPMKKLLVELSVPRILSAFLSKALFNSNEVKYLTIHREDDDSFHIFENKDVIEVLKKNLNLKNSCARHEKEYDCQKVIFQAPKGNGEKIGIGEIELRNDSDTHYREMKFRLNGNLIFALLKKEIDDKQEKGTKVFAYGSAIKTFKNL